MADPVWPVGLPQNPYALDGARYVPMDNQQRSQMDMGPQKVRRRFTAVAATFSFQMELTKAELAILTQFQEVTLQDTRRFQWIDFRTGLPCKYRFARRPGAQYVAGDGELWLCDIELERMP